MGTFSTPASASTWSAGVPAAVEAVNVARGGHPNRYMSFHNPDNASLVTTRGLVAEDETFVTLGSGVDPARFPAVAEAPVGDEGPLVVLPTRLLWHKCVGVFVEAARRLRAEGVQARFAIVGGTDPENPASVPAEALQAWHDAGPIEWWGPSAVRRHAPRPSAGARGVSAVVLPGGRAEGLARSRVHRRPIVTTDVPGCREVMAHEENGFLVPPQDPDALAERLHQLLTNDALRQRMGRAGRARVEARFTAEQVATSIVEVYDQLTGAP